MEIERGVGAAIVAEEAFRGPNLTSLSAALSMQPAWSDIPLIILTASGNESSSRTWDFVRRLEPIGNAFLLERPLRPLTLAMAVHVALRSRRRQYEVKSLNENLEARVAARTAELQWLNSEAEGFNYSISHDLRAPLRAIVGTSQMMLHDFKDELPREAVPLLQRQSDAASRMALLIDELLKLSRLSRQEMKRSEFCISQVALQVVAELQNGEYGHDCRFEIEANLKAFGDSALVKFVLLNLLENAVKFSPYGGCIRFGRADDGAFFVRDHGIGFDMKYVNKVFLPFERLVTDSEFPGTGIGLANVKRIVDRHSGSLRAESELGKGATFYFTLPKPTESAFEESKSAS
jgi:signal transduction histidine kinase